MTAFDCGLGVILCGQFARRYKEVVVRIIIRRYMPIFARVSVCRARFYRQF